MALAVELTGAVGPGHDRRIVDGLAVALRKPGADRQLELGGDVAERTDDLAVPAFGDFGETLRRQPIAADGKFRGDQQFGAHVARGFRGLGDLGEIGGRIARNGLHLV